MLHAEEYYAPTDVGLKKGEAMYQMANTNILQENMGQPLNDKVGNTTLLNEMGEFKPMNGQNCSSNMDEQRALQLAFELSMLGLTSEEEMTYNELRMKKSMNMTECVPVPSSEHVAEIVGRQGCKIKALRAKTNTYIKTPVRGEEPVFVVTGRKEDVGMAKREILQAAEHFSQIRASRRNSSSLSPLGSPAPTAPGHITKQVRVPYRVVGLVVGPKGSTIKRIQQATNTYIVTPSRDKEPIFEVTGLPDNVDRAKREVEQHIALRTGGIFDPTHPELTDQLLNGFGNSSLFSPTGSSSGGSFSSLLDNHSTNPLCQRSHSVDSFSYLSGQSNASSKFSDLSSAGTSPFNNNNNNAFFCDTVIPSPTADIENGMGQFDPAPGSPAPSLWPEMMIPRSAAFGRPGGPQMQPMPPTRSLSVSTFTQENSEVPQLRRLLSESAADPSADLQSTYSHFNGTTVTSTVQSPMIPEASIIDMTKVNTSDGESQSSSPDWMANKQNGLPTQQPVPGKNQCFICNTGKVVAALVPCGHNLFCLPCAEQMKENEGDCPVCQKKVEAFLRIIS